MIIFVSCSTHFMVQNYLFMNLIIFVSKKKRKESNNILYVIPHHLKIIFHKIRNNNCFEMI